MDESSFFFFAQEQMVVYIYGDTVINIINNIMLFRGLISLVVLLWSEVAFHVIKGRILICLTLAP